MYSKVLYILNTMKLIFFWQITSYSNPMVLNTQKENELQLIYKSNNHYLCLVLCPAPFLIAQRLILCSHKIWYMSNQCYFCTRGEL